MFLINFSAVVVETPLVIPVVTVLLIVGSALYFILQRGKSREFIKINILTSIFCAGMSAILVAGFWGGYQIQVQHDADMVQVNQGWDQLVQQKTEM